MGAPPKVSNERIAAAIRKGLTPTQMCDEFDLSYSSPCKQRFEKIALSIGVPIRKYGHGISDETRASRERINEYMQAEGRKQFAIQNGVILIGSDAHYHPGLISTAHRAFVKFAADLRPSCVILNGDGMDGASISRYPRIGWDKRPTVAQELQAGQERLGEIEDAARTKNLFWPLGNHDARLETFLAAHAPEYEGVKGFKLKDHFPLWIPCWAVHVNENVVIKHRFKSGVHAPHNNAMWAGRSIVTGHLHSLKVTPLSDYNGVRYGVDCGTLAAPYGPQFADYTELNPVSWRSGFAFLTFWKGHLLWPEIVHVIDEEKGLIQWRGKVEKV